MSAFKNKINPDFSEGVDRKLLRQVRDRFLQVNAERLDKCYAGLSIKHQDVLRILPLLYHVNHPLLPGYAPKTVPLGLSAYEPDKTTLSIARSFSATFKFKASGKKDASSIYAIYMMGSTGTLAHSESSDVDLWLCHDPALSNESLAVLSEKAKKIDEWANSQGLELHTFLMNAEKFREGKSSGPADKESSGSAQHYLLLDEFYRTAILLAGRYPVWWLVPPAKEAEYNEIVDLFLSKRFLKGSEVIDFGSAADIPKSELIGAGLWQLYKGLDSPYKSVLKILLAEVYAQELPNAETLSQVFKQAVYDDELSAESLDPYLLVYKRLESYLIKRREHKRLDVVQKSFYLKVAKKLSRKPSSARGASWQRKLLEKIVRKWGWSDDKFQHLDNRVSWKVDQVVQERQSLVAELSFSYRFLSQYARANKIRSSITSEDLNLLGRKLYAIFQKKAGKIDRINPGIVGSLWEENLSLHHSSTQAMLSDMESWLVYRDLGTDTDASFEVPLKKGSQLVELLAWLYFNGIFTSSTRISLSPGRTSLTLSELKSFVRALETSIPMPLPEIPQSNYQCRASVKRMVLFVNLGTDPMRSLGESGFHVLTDRTNALDYGEERVNLVKTIDQVCLNTWNEVSAYRYEAGETILQCLQAFLQLSVEQREASDCQLDVYCFSTQRANAISERVSQLFEDVKNVFLQGDSVHHGRYVLELGKKYYIIQYVDDQFRYYSLDSDIELYRSLIQCQRVFSPIVLDSRALEHEGLLKSVLPLNLKDTIQVFYFPVKELYQVIVLDESGGVQRLLLPRLDEDVFQTMVIEMSRRMLESRQMSEGILADSEIVIQLNKVSKKEAGKFKARTVKKVNHSQIGEVIVLSAGHGDLGQYDVMFQGMEFSSYEYGDRQFDALVHYAYSTAHQSPRIPLVISEVLESPSMQIGGFKHHKNHTQETFSVLAITARKLFDAVERYFQSNKH